MLEGSTQVQHPPLSMPALTEEGEAALSEHMRRTVFGMVIHYIISGVIDHRSNETVGIKSSGKAFTQSSIFFFSSSQLKRRVPRMAVGVM